MSAATFGFLYLILVVPTYFLPWLGSNSLLAALATGGGTLFLTLIHCMLLLGTIGVACLRAHRVGKIWLVGLPMCAAVFDLVPLLVMIPFVPSVFHLCTLASLTLLSANARGP